MEARSQAVCHLHCHCIIQFKIQLGFTFTGFASVLHSFALQDNKDTIALYTDFSQFLNNRLAFLASANIVSKKERTFWGK